MGTPIASLNKKYLKNIAGFLNDEILRLTCYYKYIQWYHAALDSIESKIYKPDAPKFKRRPSGNNTVLIKSPLYNFADDNVISTEVNNSDELLEIVKEESESVVKCFRENNMTVILDQFQAIVLQNRNALKTLIMR